MAHLLSSFLLIVKKKYLCSRTFVEGTFIKNFYQKILIYRKYSIFYFQCYFTARLYWVQKIDSLHWPLWPVQPFDTAILFVPFQKYVWGMHNSHLERLEHFTRRLCRANIIRSPISDNYGVNWEFLMVDIPVSSFVRLRSPWFLQTT